MACKLTVVVGDPSCDFKGAANDQVTLTLVPTPEIAFTLESGVKDLSVLYTLSPNSTAELHEKCVGNTLLGTTANSLRHGFVSCCDVTQWLTNSNFESPNGAAR